MSTTFSSAPASVRREYKLFTPFLNRFEDQVLKGEIVFVRRKKTKKKKKSKKITASRPQEGCSIMKWSPTLLSKRFCNKISPEQKFSPTK